ncbi:histidinol-phosphate transaminase [Aquimarina brevivitae]|uniref:Histidinol-phosphate aminotransferase n=1 Tax=Aquimarina brevivitae TaxID=323412 RepID=A0A4Q7P2B4_9FLAO|nr:histidinol-phosphate transaminase [Aquimarina brevivitae]RZS93727.1 histidinol-phosphate aminotransferase [Aquimarina brevivitae]
MKITQFNIDTLIRDNVKHLKPYSSARDEYVSDGSEMVFLDANENPFENGVNRYPDPLQRKVKEILAAQKKVSPTNILLGNGSDEVLDLIFRVFCEPKEDNIISLPPTYGMYKVLCGINNIENREVLLTEDFQLDIENIAKSIDEHTKIIFVCSPNNPTGNTIATSSIEQLLTSFNGLVVIDEAYIDFSANESWINRLEQFPNLIVTQTLSKAYGLAGIRLGVCYASPEIISTLNKIKPPYNVNELTQKRALERLQHIKQVKEEVAQLLTDRKKLNAALLEVPFIEEVFPSDANFLLARVDDANKRYDQLLAKGIVVRNRSTQPLCDNTLRFTIGTAQENQQLMDALRSIAAS